MLTGALGCVILIWMVIERIFFNSPLSNRIWPTIGTFLMLVGFQLIISGLLADILIKTYHRTNKERAYKIKEIIENK